MLGERVLQVWRWYLQRFRRYRKKTRGGLEIAPPSGARVNGRNPENIVFFRSQGRGRALRPPPPVGPGTLAPLLGIQTS